METGELYNSNRDELFQTLKGKCKKIAKLDFWGGLICLIITIGFLILIWQRLNDPFNMVYFIFWAVYFCGAVWMILYNYRFLKKFDNLDTPDQLLYWFEKKNQKDIICWFASMFLVISTNSAIVFKNAGVPTGIIATVLCILVIVLLYYGSSGSWNRRNNDIIEDLQELVEKE